jgi:hypothetical protein
MAPSLININTEVVAHGVSIFELLTRRSYKKKYYVVTPIVEDVGDAVNYLKLKSSHLFTFT